MNFIHETRDERFRKPFGARPEGDRVYLAVEGYGWEQAESVTLHYSYGLYDFASGHERLEIESLSPDEAQTGMQGEPRYRWSTTFRLPGNACLFFYFFEITMSGNRHFNLVSTADDSDGSYLTEEIPSVDPEDRAPQFFQITVYSPKMETPAWSKGAVMYQIFPDRFARGADYSFDKMRQAWPAPERIYHADWSDDVDFLGKPGYGYLACDFFGGTLQGIEENLEYIAALGVDVIYLNPIYQARSNHRYDAADYLRIDPILGTNDDFRSLCASAEALGLRILVDIALSHTGADSLYFNRFGRYPGNGAWQEEHDAGKSPYYSWYNFYQRAGELVYSSWWGFPDLPAVNENNLNFREFILGEGGVLQHWLRLGAAGFRLDVSDELPDDFLRDLYRMVKREDPEALIVGEVWEDATNKHSYGSYRDFALGNTHDAFMNYPFREAVLEFFSGSISAIEFTDALETLRENYPPEIFANNMNLLGSHDVARFMTAVSKISDPGERAKQVKIKLSDAQRKSALARMKMAVVFQTLYPGMPSIYYGDELGMEGFRDPFNRRTFDWGLVDVSELVHVTQKHFNRRSKSAMLRHGYVEMLYARGEVLAFRRYSVKGEGYGGETIDEPEILVLLNFSAREISYDSFNLKLEKGSIAAHSYHIIQGDEVETFTVDLKPDH